VLPAAALLADPSLLFQLIFQAPCAIFQLPALPLQDGLGAGLLLRLQAALPSSQLLGRDAKTAGNKRSGENIPDLWLSRALGLGREALASLLQVCATPEE
jgi:hypothetical protein